jgi:hypothetical protein
LFTRRYRTDKQLLIEREEQMKNLKRVETPMPREERNERGIALLLALFALVVVTSIGLAMMFLSDTETSINSNFRDEQTAYYASKAGLEEARDRMRTGATNSINASLPTALPGNANSILYITNPSASDSTISPWNSTDKYFDDEICKEASCGGSAQPSNWHLTAASASSTYSASPVMPYKWMRVTLKTDGSASGWSGATQKFMYVDGKAANASYYVCWNGTNEFASSTACASPNFPVYMLTTLAMTPSGTRRMLQYEVTKDTFNVNFPSALTLDGTSDTFSGPNSNNFVMDGTDHAGCGGAATQPARPAIGVIDNADISTVVGGIPSNRQSHYTGAGSAPDVENVSSSLSSSLNTPAALDNMMSTIKGAATQVLTGPLSSLSNPGTSSSPQIIYVNGDLSLSGNTTVYGLLVVTGTLSMGGNVGVQGLVMVVGQGVFNGNGGGNNQYLGSVFVAKTRDSMGNLLSTLGSPAYSFSGGGGNGVAYSSGCIAWATSGVVSDYRMVAQREMMY